MYCYWKNRKIHQLFFFLLCDCQSQLEATYIHNILLTGTWTTSLTLRQHTYLSASFDWFFNGPRGCCACCTTCLQPELLESTESLWLLPESLPGPAWCPAAVAPPLPPVKLRRTSVGELSLDVVSGALLSTLAIPTHQQVH